MNFAVVFALASLTVANALFNLNGECGQMPCIKQYMSDGQCSGGCGSCSNIYLGLGLNEVCSAFRVGHWGNGGVWSGGVLNGGGWKGGVLNGGGWKGGVLNGGGWNGGVLNGGGWNGGGWNGGGWNGGGWNGGGWNGGVWAGGHYPGAWTGGIWHGGHRGYLTHGGLHRVRNQRRHKTTKKHEFEQTVTTRVKKTIECEWECKRSTTCQHQWRTSHRYWGKCRGCSSC